MTETDRERWHRWKESVFGSGYMIWHEGLDTRRVTRLRGRARQDAQAMLALGLQQGDPHAGQALAALGSPDAIPQIEAAMEAVGPGIERMQLALALHRLVPSDAHLEPVLAMLSAEASWSHRMDAAIALRLFPGERATEAALRAMSADPHYHVRYHAADSAHALLGLGRPAATDDPTLVPLLRDR
ncbi:MAG: hypothetical protein KDK70_22050, partial [Myxococcales bacterium]|nr:hypothetical protein [Myxococcales bacterium]